MRTTRPAEPENDTTQEFSAADVVETVNGMKLSLDSLVCCVQEDFRRPEGPGQSHP